MKNLLLLILAFTGVRAAAQGLAPNQNPNYRQSMQRYAAQRIALQSTMNTTVQSTYKAYDWRTAKSERKAESRAYRRSLSCDDYRGGYYGAYGQSNYYEGFNNYYFGNRYYPASPYQYRYSYGPRRHW